MACARKCLTTGVLNRNTATNIVHIEVGNFSDTAQRVAITVFNWDVSPVAPIPGCTFDFVVPANQNQILNCNLPAGLIHYDVRVNIPVGPDVDVVVNVFGVTGPPTDPTLTANQEGNTVLFKDLVPICYDQCNTL